MSEYGMPGKGFFHNPTWFQSNDQMESGGVALQPDVCSVWRLVTEVTLRSHAHIQHHGNIGLLLQMKLITTTYNVL